VTVEALAPFRRPPVERPGVDPRPLPYLVWPENEARGAFDVTVDVFLRSAQMRERGISPVRVSRASLRDMYWTVGQMVTHQTSNGCNLRPGDLLGSGTISGPESGSEGCLLEKTQLGIAPLELPTGETRAFLLDGDEVMMRGRAERAGYRTIGFGDCSGVVISDRLT